MNLKESYYNLYYHIEDNNYVLNTANCALAEINDDFTTIIKSPNNPIILKDGKYSELRNNMLSAGFLVNLDVDEKKILQLRHLAQVFSKDDFTLTISPTMRCNFGCPYCFEKKDNLMMSDATVNEVINFAKEYINRAKRFNVVWFGGEPLLATDIIWKLSESFFKIAEENNAEYSAFMISNSYLFDKEIVEKMVKYKINSVQVTIDGPKEIHNQRRFIRKNTSIDTYSRIVDNVKLLCRYDILPKIRINIDKTNVSHIEELIECLAKENLGNVKISIGHVLAITDECDAIANDCLSIVEFSEWSNKFYNILNKNGFKLFDNYPFYPIPKNNYCGANQINSFVIQPDGKIYKCWDDTFKGSVGTVQHGIAKNSIEQYNLSQWLLFDPFDDKECLNCKYLPICMGGCPHLKRVTGRHSCEKWKYGLKDIIKNMVSI